MPRTPRTKSRARAASAGRPGTTPPSISDELMKGTERKLFTDDGRKVRDTEHVGARSPDTDPPEPGAPAHAGQGRPHP